MGSRIALAVTLAVLGSAVSVTPASALLSLSAGAAPTLSPFRPGGTATGGGTLTITTLLAPWTLTVQDNGTGAGRMVPAATGCAGSDPLLTNALTVAVTGPAGVTSAGRRAIGSSAVQVASGGGLLNLAALTTSYSQLIPATQVLGTGCAYNLTAIYTLQ